MQTPLSVDQALAMVGNVQDGYADNCVAVLAAEVYRLREQIDAMRRVDVVNVAPGVNIIKIREEDDLRTIDEPPW